MDAEWINGEIFEDHRGRISSLNSFSYEGVRRSYFITHSDTSVIRGWNGHKLERKWFYCVRGAFRIALVRIDNWETPSPDLVPEIYHLSEKDSRLLCVPGGYASSIKADQSDSTLMVLSDRTMAEAAALNDNYKFDPKYFFCKWSD